VHTDTLFVVGYKTYPMNTYSRECGVYMDTRGQFERDATLIKDGRTDRLYTIYTHVRGLCR